MPENTEIAFIVLVLSSKKEGLRCWNACLSLYITIRSCKHCCCKVDIYHAWL